MLKMVDGTGIIGVDMICPLGVSTPQPPNYDRVELEGTGMLVLPNSLDAPLERLELGGKTEQVQTTGKNLFDFSNLESGRINISTGALEEHNHTRRLADYIDITDITSFSFYLPGYNKANGAVYVIIYYYDKDKNYLSYKPCGDKIEKYENITPVENAVYIKVSLEQNTIDNPQNIFKVQLEKGAKSTAYEPYTGGKPSPSPEYPQEIKNSGKWNEETQKYEVDVKVVGKNVFDVDYFTKNENYQNKEGDATYWKYATFKVKPNTTYTVSKQKNANVNGAINNGLYYGGALAFSDDVNSAKITTKDDGLLYVMFFYRNQDVNILKEMDIQVELGETLTEYEPYKEQTLTLTSDRPLTKWDRLVEKGGEYGWLYGSAINEYRGDTVVSIYENGFYFLLNNKKLKSGEGYCEELKQYVTREGKPSIAFNMSPNTYAYTINTQAIYGSTVSAIKEYLKTHPLHLVYKTETTEFIPLPQSEQNAIRALKTYYPTTVITVDGGEVDPDIKVTYRKEI